MRVLLVIIMLVSLCTFSQRKARFKFDDQTFKVGSICELDKNFKFESVSYQNHSDKFYEMNKDVFDQVINFLIANPSLIIEVGYHTDSKGDEKENMDLSQIRADQIIITLTSHNIPENQLIAKGYGESMPLVPTEKIEYLSKKEQDSAHQMNRRTELKIIKIKDTK